MRFSAMRPLVSVMSGRSLVIGRRMSATVLRNETKH
jgi:hypothetical protein